GGVIEESSELLGVLAELFPRQLERRDVYERRDDTLDVSIACTVRREAGDEHPITSARNAGVHGRGTRGHGFRVTEEPRVLRQHPELGKRAPDVGLVQREDRACVWGEARHSKVGVEQEGRDVTARE